MVTGGQSTGKYTEIKKLKNYLFKSVFFKTFWVCFLQDYFLFI